MMVIDNKYNIGDLVFLKTDQDQLARMVICISLTSNGISYELASGAISTSHYELELSKEKNIVLNTSN